MALCTVFFDVDDTLVDFDAAARRGFAEALGADADYAQWVELSKAHFPRFTSGERSFGEMRDERMMAFLASLGQVVDRETAAATEERRMALIEARYELFPDVEACLAAVRSRGLSIGLITNNESAHQRRKIAATGLEPLIDEAIISGEVGVAKPDPAIFDVACQRLQVDAAEAVHVGDRLFDDVHGALQAGLAAVWLARPAVVSDEEAQAGASEFGVPVIRSLDQLPELLDYIGGVPPTVGPGG